MIAPRSLTVGVVTAHVKMLAAASHAIALLVEGPTDIKFWRERCDNHSCNVVPCGSKATVIGSVTRLETDGIAPVMGIVDDDRDRHFGIAITSPNVCVTDVHDLEALLLRSDALERVVREFCDTDKIANFEKTNGVSVRAALESRAMEFAKLRYVSRKSSYEIGFKCFSPWKYLDENWLLDGPRLHDDFAASASVTLTKMRSELECVPALPAWTLIQGHDAMNILRCGMTRVLGAKAINKHTLFPALSMAFTSSMFETTALHAGLRSWEVAKAARILG